MNKKKSLNDMPQIDIQKVNRAISDDYDKLNAKKTVKAIQSLKLDELLVVLMHELRSKQRRSVKRAVLTRILGSPEALVFKEKYQGEAQEGFTILQVGQTGVGKSETINSLFGEKVAETNKFEPETGRVKTYDGKYHKVKYTIYDTPGLGEWNNDRLQLDDKYLSLVKEQCPLPDILWFFLRLNDHRITAADANALQLIHNNFDNAIWDRTMIVFTHADMFKTAEEFEEYFDGRTRTANETITQVTDGKVQRVPAVAVANGYEKTPNGKRWLGELFTTSFERLNPEHQNAFILAFAMDLEIPKPQPQNPNGSKRGEKVSEYAGKYGKRIKLTDDQVERVEKGSSSESDDLTGVLTKGQFGTTIDLLSDDVTLGIPTIIGAVIGGIAGFIKWLWD